MNMSVEPEKAAAPSAGGVAQESAETPAPPQKIGTGVFMPRTSMVAGTKPAPSRRSSINLPATPPPRCASGQLGRAAAAGERARHPPARCATASSISWASAQLRRRSGSSHEGPARTTSCRLLDDTAHRQRVSPDIGGSSCSAFTAALQRQPSSCSSGDAHALQFVALSPRMSLDVDAAGSCSFAWPDAHGGMLLAEHAGQHQLLPPLPVSPGSSDSSIACLLAAGCMPAAAAAAHQAASSDGWCALPHEGGRMLGGNGAGITGAGSLALAPQRLAPVAFASEPLASAASWGACNDSIEPLLLAPNTDDALHAIDERLAELLALQQVLLARKDASGIGGAAAAAGLAPSCSLQAPAGGHVQHMLPATAAASALAHCTAPPPPALLRHKLDVAAADVLHQLAVMQQAEARLHQELLQIVSNT